MASEAEVKPLQQPAAAPPASGPTHPCGSQRRCRLLAALGIGALAVVLVGPWRWAGGSAPELPPPCTNGCANFSHALWSSVLGAHLQPNVRCQPRPLSMACPCPASSDGSCGAAGEERGRGHLLRLRLRRAGGRRLRLPPLPRAARGRGRRSAVPERSDGAVPERVQRAGGGDGDRQPLRWRRTVRLDQGHR